jgi:hypothetical protein
MILLPVAIVLQAKTKGENVSTTFKILQTHTKGQQLTLVMHFHINKGEVDRKGKITNKTLKHGNNRKYSQFVQSAFIVTVF